ncbi:MAG: TIGR04283 family arsenosugar biosynthesis glycosyltransferase [Ginsengibacter sp.]
MKKACALSIIIPTFNEAENITSLINFLKKDDSHEFIEIIITDGGSTDDTIVVATSAGVTTVVSPIKGRGAQMNYGASFAKADILYFLHADSFPPAGYAGKIAEQVKNGYGIGCFRLQFETAHWFLKANAWFTRFDCNAFRFGDQSLFVLKDIFIKAGGFNEKLIVMEDQEIIYRLKKYSKFKIMPQAIITSARKYTLNGIYKMQGIFFLIYFMYKIGTPQNRLKALYRRLIKQDKV